MISPDFLMQYAHSKGVTYLYDANGDHRIDTKDVDIIAQNQQIAPFGNINPTFGKA